MFLNKLFFKNSERGKYSTEDRVLANIQLMGEKKNQESFFFFKWPVIWKLEEATHTHTHPINYALCTISNLEYIEL